MAGGDSACERRKGGLRDCGQDVAGPPFHAKFMPCFTNDRAGDALKGQPRNPPCTTTFFFKQFGNFHSFFLFDEYIGI
jgi:hypothetical protein